MISRGGSSFKSGLPDEAMNAQTWDAAGYEKNARFVTDLGIPASVTRKTGAIVQ